MKAAGRSLGFERRETVLPAAQDTNCYTHE